MSRRNLWRVAGELANLILITSVLLPIFALLLGALQTERDLFANIPHLLPRRLTLVNIQALLRGHLSGFTETRNFPAAFLHSFIVSAGTTVLGVFAGTLSAYAIARLMRRAAAPILVGLLATRMVPLVVLIIPLFVLLKSANLLNTFPGLILAESGFVLPYAIWILISHFASLPSELEDAARADGCTRFAAFWRIMLPLSTPGIAACAVVVFLITWNDLLLPLILGSADQTMTLPVFISSFITDRSLSYTVIYAAGLLTMLPTILAVVLLQRFVVRGLTAGAIKG